MRKFVIVGLVGLCAGFLNGLLGTGGGILLLFAFAILYPQENPKDQFAMVIASILPMSAVSAFFYMRAGNIPFSSLEIYGIPAIAGGLLGAFLLEKIKVTWLKKIFAMLVIYAGIRMMG